MLVIVFFCEWELGEGGREGRWTGLELLCGRRNFPWWGLYTGMWVGIPELGAVFLLFSSFSPWLEADVRKEGGSFAAGVDEVPDLAC